MKGLLIDPFEQKITVVEFDGSLEAMYKLLDCNMIEAVHLNDDGDIVYVDEEGLLTDLSKQAFFLLTGTARAVALAGKGLVVGTDDEGNTVDPTADIRDVAPMITWKTLAELRSEAH